MAVPELEASPRVRPAGPGPGEVLALVRRYGTLTRAEIQDLTGYSRVTVGQRVSELLDAGLLTGGGDRKSTGGRRPIALRFDTGGGLFAMAAFETTRMRTSLTDLAGTVLAVDAPRIQLADGPERCLAAVQESVTALLRAHGRSRHELSGIGISLPGPVDPGTMRPSEPPIMPGWDGYPVADRLGDAFGVPVIVENDANVMALGEQRHRFADAGSLVLVKVSTGIGAGIVIDGTLFQGVDGGAGDIGHTRLRGAEDAECRCGGRGCLAAVASGAAVARRLAGTHRDIETGHDVRALLEAGDADAQRAVTEAGQTVGVVLAGLIALLNPAVLVLSGDLASTALLGGVRSSLYRLTLPRATRHLEIVLGTGAGSSAVLGLAARLVDSVFSPAAVDARIRS